MYLLWGTEATMGFFFLTEKAGAAASVDSTVSPVERTIVDHILQGTAPSTTSENFKHTGIEEM